MNFTRATAFLFILLAYGTMLAHAIVPHHHHNSAMYLVKGEFRHDECCEIHNGTVNHSSEDEHQHEDQCGLQLPILLRANEDEAGNGKSLIQELLTQDFYDLPATDEIIAVANFIPFKDSPFHFVHSGFFPDSESLRGPPSII